MNDFCRIAFWSSRRVAFLVTGLGLAPLVSAQEGVALVPGTESASVVFERPPYRLVFDHVKRTWAAYDNRGGVRRAAQPAASGVFVLDLPPGNPVEVVVSSANPLLYEYSLEPLVVRSAGVRGCGDVGRGFASSGFLVAVGAVRNMNEPAPPLEGLLTLPSGTGKALGEEGGMLQRSELLATLEAARPAVQALNAFVTAMAALPPALDDSLAVMAERGDAEPLGPGLDRLLAYAEQQSPGLGRAATVPTAVNARLAGGQAAFGSLLRAAAAIQAGRFDGDTAARPAREAIGLTAQLQSLVDRKTTLESVRALQRRLAKIEQTRARLTQSAAVPASGDYRRLVLRLKPSAGYPDVVRTFEGPVEAFLRPRVGLLCEISTGFNMMTAHENYLLASDGTLLNASNDDIRTSPALFLHLSPTGLGVLGGLFGIGLGADRAPDLYLGASLRTLAPVLINGGIVWQRHRRASGELRVGDVVPAGTRVEDFPRRFSAGWFLGVSITP
jgi:hypothetical protein